MSRVCCFLVSFVFIFFMCISCFACPVLPVSADGTSSGGGGSSRADPVDDPSTFDQNEEWYQAESWWEATIDACLSYGSNDALFDDLLSFACGAVGTIFNDTSYEYLKSQFSTIYGNDYASFAEMTDIFYLGNDGQLYFTDSFLSNFNSISDQTSFMNGCVYVPPVLSDAMAQFLYGKANPLISPGVTEALTNKRAALIKYNSSSYSFMPFFLDQTDYNIVVTFTSYNDYSNYCNAVVSQTAGLYGYFAAYDSSLNNITISSDRIYYTVQSDGSYKRDSGTLVWNAGSTNNRLCASHSTSERLILFGNGINVYTSIDWMKYYAAGNSGVLHTGTGYDLGQALNTDVFTSTDWESIYNNYQTTYQEALDEQKEAIEAGTQETIELQKVVDKLSEDVNENLGKIESGVGDIEDAVNDLTTLQTEYFKQFNKFFSSIDTTLSTISSKLDNLISGEEDELTLILKKLTKLEASLVNLSYDDMNTVIVSLKNSLYSIYTELDAIQFDDRVYLYDAIMKLEEVQDLISAGLESGEYSLTSAVVEDPEMYVLLTEALYSISDLDYTDDELSDYLYDIRAAQVNIVFLQDCIKGNYSKVDEVVSAILELEASGSLGGSGSSSDGEISVDASALIDKIDELIAATETLGGTDRVSYLDQAIGALFSILNDYITAGAISVDSSLAALVKSKFPFSLPYDVIAIINIFSATPETPVFDLPFRSDKYGFDYSINVDFAQFEDWALIIRTVTSIMFVFMMIKLSIKFKN